MQSSFERKKYSSEYFDSHTHERNDSDEEGDKKQMSRFVVFTFFCETDRCILENSHRTPNHSLTLLSTVPGWQASRGQVL